ncbi:MULTISPECIES: hypothetical protein [Psychrobacter]|uniref:hypothetical protein n=1 Tax=Psychrobacter TaxID=497 RepID=UPI00191A5060|nr:MULTISPECIES: hypothetical protein [Psychrobacter]MCG3871908.1 hypothetical protein [Psychrobacter sp. Ps7]
MTKNTRTIRKEESNNPVLKALSFKTVISVASLAALLASSGCATSSLLDSDNRVSKTTTKHVLSEDQIVAFGRPAQALPKMPNATMVIVGEKNSYVLTQGGTEMVGLLTNLTPKNIQVDNEMNFYVPNNDGYFQGEMKLSYAKLRDEFKRSDYQFFLQNNGKECTSASDQRINAQRFCFSVPVKGAIYPQVSNLSLIQSNYRPLTKPYTVSFYTQSQQNQVSRSGANTAQKLVLLPFALAFDVVTFPFQLLE